MWTVEARPVLLVTWGWSDWPLIFTSFKQTFKILLWFYFYFSNLLWLNLLLFIYDLTYIRHWEHQSSLTVTSSWNFINLIPVFFFKLLFFLLLLTVAWTCWQSSQSFCRRTSVNSFLNHGLLFVFFPVFLRESKMEGASTAESLRCVSAATGSGSKPEETGLCFW